MSIGGLFSIIVTSIFINNIIFAKFLGCCPFMGVSKKVDSSLGMGMAVTFVITIASGVTWIVYRKILEPLGLGYLQTIAFILIIASLVTVVDMIMNAYTPDLYKVLGLFIPLIVVNCIVLGRAESFASKNGVIDSILDGIGSGIGFTLSLTFLGSIRELLGNGSVFGISLVPANFTPALIFILAPGGFITIGMIMACINIKKERDAKKKKVTKK